MLKEHEVILNGYRELEPTLNLDAVVVGSGIMGLMVAKRLTDLGQQVAVLEPQPTFAYGSSIKNHGWLHRGSAHAISVKDKEEARRVVQKLTYGYEYLRSYAYECIEEPFEPIYALTENQDLAQRATSIWQDLGVDNQEVSRTKFRELDPYISRDVDFYIFKTADLKINNRMLFKKLVSDINRGGGIVLKGVNYEYESENSLRVHSGDSDYKLQAGLFVYSTGAHLDDQYQKLTGRGLEISYWKSHLIYLPRFSPYSIASLDRGLPIIINHLQTSVINRAYDEFQIESPDYEADPRQITQAFESVRHLYPMVHELRDQVRGVACIKPSIKLGGQNRHSVNSQIVQPAPNHYFVLPGKMTEAPYVADELLHRIYGKLNVSDISERPIDLFEDKNPKLISMDSHPAHSQL